MPEQHTKRILLVEDDVFLAEIYQTKLSENGFTVDLAHDGEEALEHARTNPPSLILLDLILPKRNGFSVLEELKGDPTFSAIPVIILSNLGESRDMERGHALGAAGYIIKAHFTPTEVLHEVQRVLEDGATPAMAKSSIPPSEIPSSKSQTSSEVSDPLLDSKQ